MKLLGPLRQRDFALLFSGTLVSLLGDGIYFVAVPFAMLELSDTPVALSALGVAWAVGMLAFLLAGGLMADRYDKRRQLLVADAIRLLAVGAAGGLSLAGQLEIWNLVALAFVYGAGEGLSGPALGSIVPELVPEEILVEANALSGSMRPLAMRLVGPALGGAAVAIAGTGGALLIDAATFAVSMACLLAMRARAPVAGGAEPLRSQVAQAATFVRSQTWLWATLAMSALALLVFMGPVEVLLPYRVEHDLDSTATAFGMVLAAGGLGTIIGTVAVGQAGMPSRPITFLYWVWGVATFGLCGYALASEVWHLLVAGLFFGVLSGAGNPVWSTLLQVRVPPSLRGRVASLDWLVSVALTPVSFALVGPIAALAGAQATLLAAGLLGGLTTLAALYVVPGLRAQDAPLTPDAVAQPSR
jgi:MFS family permease